jgi:SAM-dependent methyltransferase
MDQKLAVAPDVKGSPKFTETDLLAGVRKLLDERQYDGAIRYLIEGLPALLQRKLNRKEKLNHLLFLPRLIQAHGKAKHGYPRLLGKANSIERQIADLDLPEGGFLDLGCGAHDPVALASYYYLNGFELTHAIDLQPPRNPLYSALSMYDILANISTFPERYCRTGISPDMIRSRLANFSIEAFERGDFWEGLRPAAHSVRFEACDVAKSSVAPQSLALLVSFAVLEHVDDLPGVCRKLYDSLVPGGLAFHFVDLADHRSYRDSQYHPLSFLTEEDAPANMNRIRAHDQIRVQIETGFDIVKQNRVNADIPDRIRSKLLPRFAAMEERDMSTTKLYMLLRKPGRQV